MRSIYACYQMYVCLLSNVSMLAIEYVFACYQICLCLLSNVRMLACRYLIISIRHLKDQCASIHYSCVVDMVGL